MTAADEFVSNAHHYAEIVHESRRQLKQPPDPHWSELSDQLREMKASQIADIPHKLRAAGYTMAQADEQATRPFDVSPETLERLAELEHERWCAVKVKQGWRSGIALDAKAMTHPSLIPYASLPESEKEKDREMVRRIPQQLSALRLGVARI